jgi:hypothetical protein
VWAESLEMVDNCTSNGRQQWVMSINVAGNIPWARYGCMLIYRGKAKGFTEGYNRIHAYNIYVKGKYI